MQAYAARELGDSSATLVLDDTQVIKKGDKSGVGHQHEGKAQETAGRGPFR
ncbi:hypothetical protein [Streptomyces sp. 900105755]